MREADLQVVETCMYEVSVSAVRENTVYCRWHDRHWGWQHALSL